MKSAWNEGWFIGLLQKQDVRLKDRNLYQMLSQTAPASGENMLPKPWVINILMINKHNEKCTL